MLDIVDGKVRMTRPKRTLLGIISNEATECQPMSLSIASEPRVRRNFSSEHGGDNTDC